MNMTKAYRFHEAGGLDKLRLETMPDPQPQFGEVRLRVQSLSLNRADLLWLANTYLESPKFPARIGYEVAGIVEAVGPGVQQVKVGDRVSVLPAFSISDYAHFAETTVIPERSIMATPASFTPAQAASFAFAYFTGYFALFEIARLQPSQTILITAAGSTTGQAAIALAKKAGANIIATSRSCRKAPALLAAGAQQVIATDEEDLAEQVLKITGGRGADVVYDCVAGALSEKIALSTAIRGHWIVYGIMDSRPAPFPWQPMFLRAVRFDTYRVFDFTGNRTLGLRGNEEAFDRARRSIATGLADGSLPNLPIDREFRGLDSLPDAMRYMATSQAAGKIVVTL
jgi:NADPH:quinone reductase-like Zn-dependent oxidoreductase